MDVPLLTTKLYVPQVRPNLVERPRLLARLDEGRRAGCRLILVSAPAGFGKTALLADWVHAPVPVEPPAEEQGAGETPWPPTLTPAWLSLDADDNDPARFLTYLIAALNSVQTEVGDGALELLRSSQPPPYQAALVTLLNSLATDTRDFVLVLDDYHLIESRAIHGILSFLLDHIPPRMHLVIASRTDPSFPLAGLRARSQMIELRAADLRFDPDEAATFLNRSMGLQLTADQVAALEKRTEGWIAGLQLAALSMQGRKDVAGFISTFTGAQHFILDYLMEEVLLRQDEAVKAFLLQTSILERLTGSLCDFVLPDSPKHDSQSLLESLERANLFIVPLDDHLEWYRYHHLFGQFLRARLLREYPHKVTALNLRASLWFEHSGYVREAIDHALEAKDWERAASLIEKVARPMFMRGEVVKPLAWCEALPPEFVLSRPRLSLLMAWGALFTRFDPEKMDLHLQHAEDALAANHQMSAKERLSLESEVVAVRGITSLFRGDAQRMAERTQRLLGQHMVDDQVLDSMLAFNQGLIQVLSGDVVPAVAAFDHAAAVARQGGNTLIAIGSLCQAAEQRAYQGRLNDAEATYRQAVELAAEQDVRSLALVGNAHIGIGEVLRERNRLEEAEQRVSTGLGLMAQWTEIAALDGFISMARIKHAQGNWRAAHEWIDKGAQAARESKIVMGEDLVEVHRARLWAAGGDLEAASRWAHDCALSLEGVQTGYPYILREFRSLALARVRIAQGQAERTLSILEPSLSLAEKLGRGGVVIEILALHAVALDLMGERPHALQMIGRALSRAEPEGYVRLFLDLGDRMTGLLRAAAAERGPWAAFAARLVRGACQGKATTTAEAFDSPAEDEGESLTRPEDFPFALVEALTERELEVLVLMSQGKTNLEIADELVVAVSTVRSHVKSIYAKLGVSNRVQAVLHGRKFGLVK